MKTAQELMCHYEAGIRDFSRINLIGANLEGRTCLMPNTVTYATRPKGTYPEQTGAIFGKRLENQVDAEKAAD